MRLINTTTLAFSDFEGLNIPEYAILSHRWNAVENEVSYKNYRTQLRSGIPGNHKIRAFCRKAKAHGLQWAWVDTCCIDKRSSAELSEAINSMFAWYRNAKICYAFLEDVGPEDDWRGSVWWSRGWTLQELVAPSNVVFYNQKWKKLGTKDEMVKKIEALTGIPASALNQECALGQWSAAQKMSWAAGRRTTRIEDRAYCLLGLFRINMPLLYGEGIKAFQRLQLEILQKYPDESIFAWLPRAPFAYGILARGPESFVGCADMAPRLESGQCVRAPFRGSPPRVTGWGIELCANARKLKYLIRSPYHQDERCLWAIQPIIAWRGRIQELPCMLILMRLGPIYVRHSCYHGDSSDILERLERDYVVGEIETDKVFYLQFDNGVFSPLQSLL